MAIHDKGREYRTGEDRRDKMIRLRVSSNEREAWEAAATTDGQNLSEWLRDTANLAADTSAQP